MGKDGDYIDVVPMENVMVVNIADLMQIWSGDRLKSTVGHILGVVSRRVSRGMARVGSRGMSRNLSKDVYGVYPGFCSG